MAAARRAQAVLCRRHHVAGLRVLVVTPRLAVAGAVAGVIGLILGSAALLIWWRFDQDIKLASARVAHSSALIATHCGPIEYQEAGTDVPLLAVHGSGGRLRPGHSLRRHPGTSGHPGDREPARRGGHPPS